MMEASDRKILIRAVDLALARDWAAAHALVAGLPSDPVVCWLHAVLHKQEGDEANARYWYRSAGQFYESYADIQAELAAIKAALTY